MKKIIVLLVCAMIFVASCASHKSVVGNGSQTGEKVKKRQWYALWGGVPIGAGADTKEMAGGASNYTIETSIDALALILNNVIFWTSIRNEVVTVVK